jgi:hypothetical protein
MRENTKNMFDRFFHQINAPSSCCYLSKDYCGKEAWAIQKLFKKEEKREKEKERIEKMDKCLNY